MAGTWLSSNFMLTLYNVQISYYDSKRSYNKDMFQFLIDDESKVEECANHLFVEKHAHETVSRLYTKVYTSQIHSFSFKSNLVS